MDRPPIVVAATECGPVGGTSVSASAPDPQPPGGTPAHMCADVVAVLWEHRLPLLVEREPPRGAARLRRPAAHRGSRWRRRKDPPRDSVGPVRTHGDRRRTWQKIRPHAGPLGEFAGCGGARRLVRFGLPPGWHPAGAGGASPAGWGRRPGRPPRPLPPAMPSGGVSTGRTRPAPRRAPEQRAGHRSRPGSGTRESTAHHTSLVGVALADGTAQTRPGRTRPTGCARHVGRSCPLPTAGGTG